MVEEAQGAQGLGPALREAREARGLSLEDVAKALMLSNSTIRRLENEDWEGMQAPVYVRGYIGSYARLVGLDEDSLLSLYKVVDVRSANEPLIELTSVDGGHSGSRASWVFAGAALAVAAVVAVGLLLILPEVEESVVEDGVAETGEAAQAEAQEEDATLAVPAIQEAFQSTVVQDEPEAAATQEAIPLAPTPAAAVEEAGVEEPEVVAEQAGETADEGFMPQFDADESAPVDALESPPAEEVGAVRLTPLGDDEIEFVFSDTCWVEVKDLDGNYLHASLGEPNGTLLLVGQGPFDIKLGYVPGVVLRFNGAPVPLAPHSREQVASLVLGR